MTRINLSRPMLQISISASLLLLFLLLQPPLTAAQTDPSRHDPRRFSPSMAIVIVVLISAFFLMAFCSVYIRVRSADERFGGSVRRGGGARGRSRGSARPGVDRDVIDTFPVFEYSAVKAKKLGNEALECAVCLTEFEDDDNLRLLPICSHVFHPDCIDVWLASHVTCPVCRSNLVAPATDTPTAAETTDAESESRDEAPLRHVAVDIVEEPDVVNPDQTPMPVAVPIPTRSKSNGRQFRFLRSHTTGHSVVQPGENVDRFTLRLPEHVRKEVIDGKMSRSASFAAFPAGGRAVAGGSVHPRVERIGEEGGEESGGGGRFQWRFNWPARSGRWSFLSRTFSIRSQRRDDGEQTVNRKGPSPSVMTPFDCLGGKAEAAGPSAPDAGPSRV